MRILVVEDYLPLQKELLALVEDNGHEAFGASSASEATELLKKTPLDALITDIFVRKGGSFVSDGGILLISRLRTDFKGEFQMPSDAPILVITGMMERGNQLAIPDRLADFGVDACLRKPLEMSDIVDWLANISLNAEVAT